MGVGTNFESWLKSAKMVQRVVLILGISAALICSFSTDSAGAQSITDDQLDPSGELTEYDFLPLVMGGIEETIFQNMVLVPEGEFWMGCDPEHNGVIPCKYSDELPLHPVYLSSFYIDTYEVTIGEYKKCVAAGGCRAPTLLSSKTRTSYYNNTAYINYPVVYVDWYRAREYCEWKGKLLPTEAQWEKAARGTTIRAHPWGDEPPNDLLANYNNPINGDTMAVGSFPLGASPYGALDMAGNVLEWVKDRYLNTYYSISPYLNPLGPSSGDYRVMRGGSYDDYAEDMRASDRNFFCYLDVDWCSPNQFDHVGFRCAYSEP